MVSAHIAEKLVTTTGQTAFVQFVHSNVSISGTWADVMSAVRFVTTTGQREAVSSAVLSVNTHGQTASVIPVTFIVITIITTVTAQFARDPVHLITL